MANKLALPTFITGPKDDLATVDVYTVKESGVVNNIKSLLEEYNPAKLGGLVNTGEMKKELPNIIVGLKNGRLLTNKEALAERIFALSPAMSNAFKNLAGSFQQKMLLGVNTLGDGLIGVQVKSMLTRIARADLTSARGLTSFIQELSNNNLDSAFNFKDSRYVANLLGTVVNESLRLNLPGVAKDILDIAGDREVINLIAETVSSEVVKRGSSEDLYEIGYRTTPGTIQSKHPNALEEFARYYQPRYPAYSKQYNENYQSILKAYASVDPAWDTYIRPTVSGVEDCIRITPLIGASPQFNDVIRMGAMLSNVQREKAYLAAEHLTPTTVAAELGRQFPQVSLQFNKSNQTVKDPRTVTY